MAVQSHPECIAGGPALSEDFLRELVKKKLIRAYLTPEEARRDWLSRREAERQAEGLPLAYEVFDGNRADVTTVEEIVETMRRVTSDAKEVRP